MYTYEMGQMEPLQIHLQVHGAQLQHTNIFFSHFLPVAGVPVGFSKNPFLLHISTIKEN